jgi:hypothetical protein
MIKITLFYCALASLILYSCKKDNNDPVNPNNPNETELITTLKLLFQEQGNPSNNFEAVFKDADGIGGAPPSLFDTIRLEPGKVYDTEIVLLDESKNPVDSISNEVAEEGEEHQFFFTAIGADVSFAYADADKNGVPVGLFSEWTAGVATTDKNGKIRITLKHQGSNKPVTGNGNPLLGETDIEVNFPVIIE